jgi:ribosomal protein L11 methylase PrmA
MKTKKKKQPPMPSSQGEEPTAYQIATLAAALVRPQDDLANTGSMQRVTSLAVSLWNASEEALQRWKESKARQAQIRDYEAKVPDVPEWRDIPKKERKPITYQRGLEVLFHHNRNQDRDGLMLDYLKHLASSESEGDTIARANWRRMKKDGFEPGEFGRIATFFPQWLTVRRSLINAANAKQRKKTQKKPLAG